MSLCHYKGKHFFWQITFVMLRPIFVKDYFAVTKFDRHGVRQGSSVIKYRGWRYAFFRQRQMFDGDDLQIRQHQRFIVDRQVCHEKLQLSSISKSWEVSDWSKKSIRGLTCGSHLASDNMGPTALTWISVMWDRHGADWWDRQNIMTSWTHNILTGGIHKIQTSGTRLLPTYGSQ